MSAENFQTALRAYLLADSGIAALVGSRIYQAPAPPAATDPYLAFSRVSKIPVGDDLSGASDTRRERWQFDSYSANPDSATALSDALWNALHQLCTVSMSGWKVLSVQFDSDQDFDEDAQDASETAVNHVIDDYIFTRKIAPTT